MRTYRRGVRPEIFPLLASAYYLLPYHSLLELGTSCACFAKDVRVILRVDCFNSLPYKALPDMVDNACNCAKLVDVIRQGRESHLPQFQAS